MDLADRLRAALDGGPPLVVRTSGSTSEPKAVLLPGTCLLASATATHARLGGPGTWLLALPTTHIAGVQVLVRSLVAGTTPGVLSGPFRSRPFVEAASDVLASDGPRYTALVPTQLTRVLSWGGSALAALRSFDAVLVGGAAVSSPSSPPPATPVSAW
ncbi:AMP-binding protein [Actinokineospora soli]|uniref:AMP-binding protein n=1 Tax=Actinokineospora soli TaxID=1048753 RepID=A0ABW2TXC4_9PSEU